MRPFTVVPLAIALSGCAVLDTGEIDYRRSAPRTSNVGAACVPPPAGRAAAGVPLCPQYTSKLYHKNIASGAAFRTGDVFSIRLEHGMIAYMTEPNFSFRRLVGNRNPNATVGEIAILANAFEFAAPGDAAVPGFNDLSDLSRVKVVYYHPDVEQHQELNFSNIPLLAPAEYHGRPVGIQLIVLELDRVSPQMQALLKRLATLGQSSNVLPSGAAADLLLSLGSTLVGQDNDDTIFEYRFVLDPANADNRVASAPFEEGRYVLLRNHERTGAFNWNAITLDENTGQLWRGTDAVRDKSYLTLNIIKHPRGTQVAYDLQDFATLNQRLRAARATSDAPLSQAIEQLDAIRATHWRGDLRKKWAETTGAYLGLAELECREPGAETTHLKSTAELNARLAAAAMITTMKNADADNYGVNTGGQQVDHPALSDQDRAAVMADIGAFFDAGQPGQPAVDTLASFTAFKAAYFDASDTFAAAMRAAALTYWTTKTCPPAPAPS